MTGLNKIYIDLEKPKYYLAGLTDRGSRGRWRQLPILWCHASSSI